MNNGSANQAKPTSSNPKIQSFLEALRASQNATDLPKMERKTNPFSDFQAKKEIEKRRIEQFHAARSQEWNSVFSAKKRQEAQKLEEIRKELKQLVQNLKDLKTNFEQAIDSPIEETGVYHENYFEHLRKMIHTLLVNAHDANQWLAAYQNRSKKQGQYWNMARKKGNSYTQSSERVVATSIG